MESNYVQFIRLPLYTIKKFVLHWENSSLLNCFSYSCITYIEVSLHLLETNIGSLGPSVP